MGHMAMAYYRQGYNCSQCILKAAQWRFGIPLAEQNICMCAGIYNGFGINGMCSVLIAAVMVFGLLFDDKATVNRLRMQLFERFHCMYKGFYCGHIRKQLGEPCDCSEMIQTVADLVEELIAEEQKLVCPCRR